MYSKFENHKTKNLEFTDIYKLVEPINNLEKGEWLPDLYFIGKTLKEYAGFPDDYEIKALIEHAAQLSDYTDYGFQAHPSLPSIVLSSFRVSVIESVTGNNGAYAVGPYIVYAKHALSDEKLEAEKERLGRNLLVFPAHSIRGLQATYDIDTFCEQIKEIATEYDSVRICLFWKDVLLGTAEKYEKYGFEVVTAGHFYDPMFMPRLKSIIETSTMTMSNKLGTYIGYCVYFNKPHLLLNTEVEMGKISCDGEEFAEIQYNASNKMRSKLKNENIDLIYELLSKNKELITEDQYNHLNKYWGFNQVKTPNQLRKILLETEVKFHLNNYENLQKDVNELEDAIKNRDEIIQQKDNIIKNRDEIIQQKDNIIKNRDDIIKKIMNSNSWKITRHLRKIASWTKMNK